MHLDRPTSQSASYPQERGLFLQHESGAAVHCPVLSGGDLQAVGTLIHVDLAAFLLLSMSQAHSNQRIVCVLNPLATPSL